MKKVVEGIREGGGEKAGGLETPSAKKVIAAENSHSGEEIVVAAQGAGASRVHGFIPNTQLFHIMLSPYGWRESP